MNNTTDIPVTQTLPVFSMAEQLIALRPDMAGTVPFSARGNANAQWLIGIRQIIDDHSVHAHVWERHLNNDEILCLLEGCVAIIVQSFDGPEQHTVLQSGDALIIPKGCWHRLQVRQPGKMMFVTPGTGSEYQPVGQEVTA
jgi:mannose-6-phosphate isomerase-like protein (cupin superfamily)